MAKSMARVHKILILGSYMTLFTRDQNVYRFVVAARSAVEQPLKDSQIASDFTRRA